MSTLPSMFPKLIIAIYGRANVGKTISLRLLKTYIGTRLSIKMSAYTYTDIVDYSNYDFRGYFSAPYAARTVKLGISSAGDDLYAIKSGLTELHSGNCDMIFIGSRTKGAGANYINLFASNNGYEVIWLSKENIYEFSQPWAIRHKNFMRRLTQMHTVETCAAIIQSVYPGLI